MRKKKSCTYIGGQAVLSGVMMRGKRSMATAVRDSHGNIQTEALRITPPEKRSVATKIPFVRGAVNFFTTLVDGMGVTMRSSEVAIGDLEEEEESKLEKRMAEKYHVSLNSVLTVISVVVGVILAIGLFMFLPQFLTDLIHRAAPEAVAVNSLAYNFIEGGFRILVFIGYILLTMLSKDVRATYQYHGAEHKTISCYEYGLELTTENVRSCTRVHDRCGTTFLFLVMVISILVFSLANALIGDWIRTENNALNFILRFLIKLALLPFVAGISYEILKLLAKTQSPLVLPLKAPGLLLQRLTTKEPTDDMIECAITAFKKVLEMDGDESVPERHFATEIKLSKLQEKIKKSFADQGIDESDAEWILSLTLDIPRSELSKERIVKVSECKKVLEIYDQRITGRPLWYIVGDTDFYGYSIKVDERVLIPRPETEQLVEMALKLVNEGDEVLDLCTGSGAVAIAIACETKGKRVRVTASDISEDALKLARENAERNGAEVRFMKSDVFDGIYGRFNVITANPPYVRTGEMQELQKEVVGFEPRIALDGGEDGLDIYRRIAEKIRNFLIPGGTLILECGEDQANEIARMFDFCDYTMIVKDLEGQDRFVKVIY